MSWQSDHLYPMMKRIHPDGSGLFQGDNVPTIGHKRSLDGLMSIKMMGIICCGLHSHPIVTQLNTFARYCTSVIDTTLLHLHQNMKWSFWKHGIPSLLSHQTLFVVFFFQNQLFLRGLNQSAVYVNTDDCGVHSPIRVKKNMTWHCSVRDSISV